MTSVAVIGDVHGAVGQLKQLLEELEARQCLNIFVGDYVNGTEDSRSVIDILSERASREPSKYVFLAGNHDLALLQYASDGVIAPLLRLGGLETLSAYLPEVSGDVHSAFRRTLPESHLLFLRSLRPCWETKDILVSHTGFDPERPDDRSVETMAAKSHAAIFHLNPSDFPKPVVVCGHYVQRNHRPFNSKHLICVDTGCGTYRGPLTAVLLPEREFLMV